MHIKHFVRLLRPVNSFMMGLAVLVGLYMAEPNLKSWTFQSVALGFVTGFTLTGASMALNDYFDRYIDAINEPNRPIPSGAISPSQALAYAIMLSTIGLTASAFTSTKCLLLAMLSAALSVAYTSYGKKTGLLGNMMVSGCIAIPFIYGALLIERLKISNILAASTAFLANTGREVTKGIVDVEGDRKYGINTTAVKYGNRIASYVATALYLSAVLITPIPTLIGNPSLGYLFTVAFTDIGFITSSIIILKNPSREKARRVKNTIVLWMLLGLLAFLQLQL
ncbi:geranylgeranylglycerol-phosphate geranylgeranyltransferase [Candidatus Bathyarchaeota archaeon]|nr:geranylgeranylglycerol-phosphate geranylgeranyltransferase [Candidatus Bathyarchaeota archaeon]MBS7613482.1 geranylgeranylglycerol-phosphate geranylgeranyltransferase [Candidatus Bathyarchaeota archaeon]MBS7618173.1 geranylgeranylglycerol-phosphate geranylgeranyltransferase [Candidatus Bathyarchaeota archaeon]